MSFFKWDDVSTVELAPQVKRKIVHLENVMLVYIELEPGAEVPVHQHPHEQIGLVLQGKAEFILGDEKRVIGPGDGYLVPPNMIHGSGRAPEERCILLDIFSPIREDFLTQE